MQIIKNPRAPYSVGYYLYRREGVIARLIDDYKFKGCRSAYLALADLVNAQLPELEANTVIVPVPTAPKNIRLRGYDHMWLIAKQLAELRQVRVSKIIKRRSNITQHYAKTAKERRHQAKQFFEVVGRVDQELNYLIIDDILTTGSTAKEAAKALRRAGARNISLAVIVEA